MTRKTVAASPEGRAARWALAGAALGFLLVTGAVAAVSAALGNAVTDALGVGAFVGIWGGTGFGFMLGGCLALSLDGGSS